MNEILQAREDRSNHIQTLIKDNDYKTIVVLKANVPGIDKNIPKMRFICNFYNKLIHDTFNDAIEYSERVESLDGNYIYYIINETGNMVKEKTIIIEDENRLGRLVDIDVYYNKPITREELSCEMRKCLICNNFAHICARSKAHSEEDIFSEIDRIIDDFLTEFILIKAIKCIFTELDMYPKFGLVSRVDSGAHTDMNYQTFVDSAMSIKPYLKEFIEYGLRDIDDPFLLQDIGKRAEEAMFEETDGVNTLKGLIFILGLFLPVITKAILHNKDVSFIKSEIKRIAEVVIGDYYENLSPTSHGDQIYLRHGFKGVRGEALNGFEIVFDAPSYAKEDATSRQMNYLMYLMSKLNDTTILHRKSHQALLQVQKDMSEILRKGGYSKNEELIKMISDSYIKQNISPGGSADLFVIKMMYEELKYLFCGNSKNGICV